ncbi:MAG: glycosyltransferase [Burkholderiales bacterium]|nr:glycosyltransferase [Burkholderiales bacterium]
MSEGTTGRIDFHLHSYASNVTDYYAANSLAIPESYSDPIKLYHMLKRRGMALVTLTDHNSIDGVREMLDRGLPDVFISAEMTTTFPEDGCNIHITVANMTEAQFSEVNRLRGNVYEMVAYVDREIAFEAQRPAGNKLAYFMTHPLMSTQNRPYGREGSLTVGHIEKALLLCNCLEVHNGARTRAINDLTADIVRGLDRGTIERLANVHDIAPKGPTPWLKSVVGGSDDHSGINPGQTWTEFDLQGSAVSANALVESIRARTSRPHGGHGGPITIAHSLLKLLYEGGMQPSGKGGGKAAPKPVSVGGTMQSLLRLVFDADNRSAADRFSFQARLWLSGIKRTLSRQDRSRPFEIVLEAEVCRMLTDAGFRAELAAAAVTDDRIFLVVKTVVNRIFAHYVRNLQRTESMNLVTAIKEAVALISSNLFVSLPYLIAFMQQSSDCQIARDVRRAFTVREPQKVVLLTDTFFDVNGVSMSIKRMIREAIRREIDFTVVTCIAADEMERRMQDPEVRRFVELGRLKLFTALANLDFPEYDGLQIYFPPMLDLLKYLQESGFTKMQISTPGVVGLVGLVAAKLLQIETAATYHTSIPEYVENYTKDVSLEAIAWRYMILFYHSVDEMLVPSKFVANLLHKRGLRNRKLLVLDRWVDVDRFRPDKRVDTYWQRHGIAPDAVKFVYIGRVAIEKNLHLLAQAYRTLRESREDAHLIVIGDGPYRAALQDLLQGLPATFTGYLQGEELATALASCDVKVFPSTTDTWGNAPLEAQASGLPVIVTDIGGPAELMQDGVTGIMVRGHDVRGLQSAMLQLMDGSLRIEMGRAARAYAEVNRVDEPFTAVLDSEAYRRQLRKKKRAAARAGAGASSADGAAVAIISSVAANEPLAVTAADARAMALAGDPA